MYQPIALAQIDNSRQRPIYLVDQSTYLDLTGFRQIFDVDHVIAKNIANNNNYRLRSD